jgi:hypothetical protein
LLPRFVVARRTAITLPQYERVSRRCRARTLFHLPSIVAFAIRCWRRCTSCSAFFQSIWFQPDFRWGAAPGARADRRGQPGARAPVICFASLGAWPTLLALRHLADVCSLSRGVMLPAVAQPLSGPLQVGLRFFRDPVPPAPWARLTACFPRCRGGLGALPRSAHASRWVRPRLFAGGRAVCGRGTCSPTLRTTHLLVQAFCPCGAQHLRLVGHYGVYQRFTCVGRTTKPSLRPPWCWQSQPLLAVRLPPFRAKDTLSRELRFRPGRVWTQKSRSDRPLVTSYVYPDV